MSYGLSNKFHLVDAHPRNSDPGNSARDVSKGLKLESRTVQRWYKPYKRTQTHCSRLQAALEGLSLKETETTKNLESDFYFKLLAAIMDQPMDQIVNNFEDLSVSKRTLYHYTANLWTFTLEKVRLEPVKRNTPKKIQTRKEQAKMVDSLGVECMANRVSIDESRFFENLQTSQGQAPKEGSGKFKVLTAKSSYLINNSHATLFF